MRKLLVLRPEPGLSASAERARRLGLEVITRPLFRVEAVEWAVPDCSGFDGVLLTSANAVGFGGSKLERLKHLPVHAVGAATADAAREVGFRIETTGATNVADLLGKLPGTLRLLHLAGQDRRDLPEGRSVTQITVYRSTAIEHPDLPPLHGLVVAVHSPRAGARLAEVAGEQSNTAIAAISEAAAAACGDSWERVETAAEPSDASLLALAARLCQTSRPR